MKLKLRERILSAGYPTLTRFPVQILQQLKGAKGHAYFNEARNQIKQGHRPYIGETAR